MIEAVLRQSRKFTTGKPRCIAIWSDNMCTWEQNPCYTAYHEQQHGILELLAARCFFRFVSNSRSIFSRDTYICTLVTCRSLPRLCGKALLFVSQSLTQEAQAAGEDAVSSKAPSSMAAARAWKGAPSPGRAPAVAIRSVTGLKALAIKSAIVLKICKCHHQAEVMACLCGPGNI
eukprot:6201095-Pleurochrysis_carterae.AAC.1